MGRSPEGASILVIDIDQSSKKAIVPHSSKKTDMDPYRSPYGQIEVLKADLEESRRDNVVKDAEIERLNQALIAKEKGLLQVPVKDDDDYEDYLDRGLQTIEAREAEIKARKAEKEKLFKDFIAKLWKMRKKLHKIVGDEVIWLFDKDRKNVFKFSEGCFFVRPKEDYWLITNIVIFLFPFMIFWLNYHWRLVHRKFIKMGIEPEDFIREVEKNISEFVGSKIREETKRVKEETERIKKDLECDYCSGRGSITIFIDEEGRNMIECDQYERVIEYDARVELGIVRPVTK